MTDPAPSAPSSDSGDRRIRSVAIVGGGTAGWLAAAVLSRALRGQGVVLHLIESSEIGAIGVGEATIPPILELLQFLGVDEADFVRHTGATYKLGIRFDDWREQGASYWHPFGAFGATLARRPFPHYWQRAAARGWGPQVTEYSLAASLGEAGRFRFPDPGGAHAIAGLRYALHFDAGLVARYLRRYAEAKGVVRLERTVVEASRRADGLLDELVFAGDGGRLRADLYIDCSGFRGLLIEETLKTGHVDWTGLLPCDRAVALQTREDAPPAPFTRATAQSAGWRWRIPLQHRMGNGYVFSSAYQSDEAAQAELMAAVPGESIVEPRILRFTTGRRRAFWVGNCVAVGLSSGFLEPLESTSIQFVINNLYNLVDHFPDRDFDPSNLASYNRQLVEEFETVRDFIILHYALTSRADTPFWADRRAMTLPETLGERLALYRGTGRISVRPGELFTDLSWFYVLDGMGVRPERYDPLVDGPGDAELKAVLEQIKAEIRGARDAARPHGEALAAVLAETAAKT